MKDQSDVDRKMEDLQTVQGLLKLYAKGRISDADEQDDFVQTVLIKAWSRRGQFRGAGKFSTWVYSIARNELNTMLRKRCRHSAAVARLRAVSLSLSPAPLDEEIVNRLEAEALLARVPKHVRCVFELIVAEDLTSAEAAKRLGLKAASIRSRFFRARRRVAELRAGA
jgi:RNA polymerase sigma-70 factor (ECF subfamily)